MEEPPYYIKGKIKKAGYGLFLHIRGICLFYNIYNFTWEILN